MASDTVPAAVPGPGDPAGNTSASPQQQPRGLAGLLSAVDPARPDTFTLQPTGEQAATGMSSADYHAGNTDPTGTKTTTNSGSGKAPQGIVRAWLLAGAERWRKGGDARIKRLDMMKAAHQANQVKETRTVSVNKSGGFLGNSGTRSGGSTTGGKGASGKSLGSKSGSGSAGKGPKNTSGNSRTSGGTGTGGASKGRAGSGSGSSGGSGGRGSNGASGSTGGGAGRGRTTTGNGSGSSGGKTPGKGSTAKETSGTRHGGDLKPRPNKTSTDKHAGKTPNSPASPAGAGKAGKDGKHGPQGPAAGTGKTTPQPVGKTSGSSKTATGDGTPRPQKAVDLNKTRKPSSKDSGKETPKGQTPKKTPDATSTGKHGKAQPSPATGKTSTGNGTRLNLLPSREAGYRDGARAGVVAAHIGAWRDGARDGWTDTQHDAERQKKHLDQAHAAHQQQRDKDKPVTGEATSADYHPTQTPTGPQPIHVTAADNTGIHLGTGADRPHLSRGEVRSLAGFQNKLTAKTATMSRIADRAKAYEAHAAAQTSKVDALLEKVKTVKGGDKLVAELTKLAEATRAQQDKATEVHKRAARAAEACTVVSANADTRYGDIYRAAADSADGPAESAYYQDLGVTHG